MFWVRLFFILLIAGLLIFVIFKKLNNKEIKTVLITYIVATIIRGITGISFNPFFDKFNLILFLKDIGIWTVSYIPVRLFIMNFPKSNRR